MGRVRVVARRCDVHVWPGVGVGVAPGTGRVVASLVEGAGSGNGDMSVLSHFPTFPIRS